MKPKIAMREPEILLIFVITWLFSFVCNLLEVVARKDHHKEEPKNTPATKKVAGVLLFASSIMPNPENIAIKAKMVMGFAKVRKNEVMAV